MEQNIEKSLKSPSRCPELCALAHVNALFPRSLHLKKVMGTRSFCVLDSLSLFFATILPYK